MASSLSLGKFLVPGKDTKRITNSVYRLRCCERPELSAQSAQLGVKLVIFDFDETLTLITLMTPDGKLLPEQEEWATKVNFESPWCHGSRVDKLNKMLDALKGKGPDDRRSLAILTRNGNASGVSAVINLLKASALDRHFAAIWTLPRKRGRPNGAYLHDGQWQFFDPPPSQGSDHKADVLKQIAQEPSGWFPQMKIEGAAEAMNHLTTLQCEEMVLVDDQRTNFQSQTGAVVQRYVKVARYDGDYREFGHMRDMGGIGANDDADYDSLKRFVEDPWMCKDTFQVRPQERDFDGQELKKPVNLVVFDFDETLTLATFMPNDRDFQADVGCIPKDWNKDDLVTYNFESPFSEGSRVAKLRKLLKVIAMPNGEHTRTLAILTKNEYGVVAVLNLLQLAGLANFFSAIWTLPHRSNQPGGAYQEEGGTWKLFDAPTADIPQHKANVLHAVVAKPTEWFPQLKQNGGGPMCNGLKDLAIEGIVLVDDERGNFRNPAAETDEEKKFNQVIRYCKVARYDDNYRDCGLLNQMGGLGAHSDEDYSILVNFIDNPWEYPYESSKRRATIESATVSASITAFTAAEDGEMMFRRDSEPNEEEPAKAKRERRRASAVEATMTMSGDSMSAARKHKTEPMKLEEFLK